MGEKTERGRKVTNEFILQDRIQKIQQIIKEYGENNFYVSFSGGLDSTTLHHLIDIAIPGNKIPRVYANTGIELNMVRNFVKELQKSDDRIIIIKPSAQIKETLERVGYPFKSKEHSHYLDIYQRNGITKTTERYLNKEGSRFQCPKILKYQFTESFKLRVSSKCCDELKKKPLKQWQKESGKKYAIIGIMPAEGGARTTAHCLAFKDNKLKAFQPLVPVTKEWEKWFIEKYGIKICDIYKPPYSFERTGCKGCPYAIDIQRELDKLEKYFPNERKQCEIIWKPVYDEYRRLGYRLKGEEK